MATPILWSFRRCPYAMRARLGLLASGLRFEWREILLRDKPEAFLAISKDGTVPVLEIGAESIQESLDILLFALEQNDPQKLLARFDAELVAQNDGAFKAELDRYKYASRHKIAPEIPRENASGFLRELDGRLGQGYLHGEEIGASDYAILPFIRQFAHVDLAWFEAQDWPNLRAWLANFKASVIFNEIMVKVPLWEKGAPPRLFGNLEPKKSEKGIDSQARAF